MGNYGSKKSKKKGKGNLRKTQSVMDLVMERDNDGGEMSQRKYDEAEVLKLKKELIETPQVFVVNMMLMSVMFFENYEKEKQRLMNSSRTTMEKELNPTLLRDETIECVIPDVIFETVNKNVRFRRLHGANKNKTEPLVPKRLYVVNDNIEVTESKHTPQYSAIDKPSYQVVVEDSLHSGFVKLKCSPSQARPISRNDNDSDEVEPMPGPSSQNDDSDTYDYCTITNINTPKSLDITSWERRDTLPKSCFAVRKIRKYDENLDSDSDEDFEEELEAQSKEELYETVSYISSNGFMTHFQNAVFPNSLGRALGFDMSEINLAKAIPGKIFCNLQDVDEDFPLLPCFIIPSVAVQWPIDQTFEFHARSERPIMWDKFNEQYQWPQDWMIKEISGLSCVLIPRGYIPKRGKNLDSEIEWELGFPRAERYLDNHMSHAQIRALLFLLTLYKSYIEPTTKYHGLLADHIRTHIYWECESNPRDWPEHRLGTRLMIVIKNLIQKLSVGHLSDFFIKKKNIFENVPNKHLHHAQKTLHDILQSPALYFIGALRNLRYNNPKFYPHLNYKKLYTILTTRNAMTLVNSNFADSRPPNIFPKIRQPKVQGDLNYRKEVEWMKKRENMNRARFLQRQREQQEREENLRNERRGSVDSVDLEFQCEKRFDNFKTREILIFFIEHFVEMSRKSRRLSTQRQGLFFLKQAKYLAIILEDLGLQSDAQDLLEIIVKEEDTAKKLSVTESFEYPPTTPKRNSFQFNWEITQQVKGNNINLNNLNNSYHNAVPQNFAKLKKNPSNLKTKPSIMRNSSIINEERRKSVENGARRSIVGFSDTIEVR